MHLDAINVRLYISKRMVNNLEQVVLIEFVLTYLLEEFEIAPCEISLTVYEAKLV